MTGTVITKKGMQLLIKVLASETMLKFTRIEVGTGGLPAGYDPANMVRLNRYKMDAMIAKCKADGDVAKITMQLGSQGIESGFIMSEIGIYAEDPDVGDILYAYLDLQDDPQYIYAEGGQAQKFLMFTLEVAIEEAAKVAAYINPEGLITRAEFERELRDVKEELARENEKTRKEFETLKNSAGTADEYDPDPEKSYHVGDYRIHQGILYKCIKNTEGEWDEECWEKTDAFGEIKAVKDAVMNPEFDDSGASEEIQSFPDFLDTFLSRISLGTFMQNLKAGLMFVLHKGQVIDNCETESEDLPLSARQGKVLMELNTRLRDDFGRVITVVIPAAGWSSAAPYTNRVAIEGMHETDNVDVTFIPGEGATNAQNIAAWEGYVGINYSVTEDGAMVFHAFETKPAVDVTVAVKGMAQRAEPEPEGPESQEESGEPETSESPENQGEVEGG